MPAPVRVTVFPETVAGPLNTARVVGKPELDVGLSVNEGMLARAPDLYAVGDVVADRPRCALEAIDSGLGAARAACRVRAPSLSP